MNRKTVLAFILTAILSLSVTALESVSAQSTPVPSVPEFSVKYIDLIYNVSPSSTTNPYTGQTTAQAGYQSQGPIYIEITIKNQPVPNGSSVYFSIQSKGHFAQDWTAIKYYESQSPGNVNFDNPYQEQGQGNIPQYTVLDLTSGILTIPSTGQIDFQVQALNGRVQQVGYPDESFSQSLMFPEYNFTGATSDWSGTQTLTINQGSNSTATPSTLSQIPTQTAAPTISPSPAPTPTSTPTASSTLPSPNPTATPQNPTTGVQTKTGTGVNWTQIALFTLVAAVAALAIAVVALIRKNNGKGPQ